MSIEVGQDFNGVIRILEDESHSLKTLAYISGFDPFSFYRGADLSGLDLSNQDLSELNFDQADLTGTDLTNIKFEIGAFNNSKISTKNDNLTDEFDGYLSDVLDEDNQWVYLFVKIRGSTFVSYMKNLYLSVTELSNRSKLSESTIRKTCKSSIISLDSARAISLAISDWENELFEKGVSFDKKSGRQPMISFWSVKAKGGFARVIRSDFLKYVEMSVNIAAMRRARSPSVTNIRWRSGPDILTWMERYYSGNNWEYEFDHD
jgi:hypothetical protein